MECIVSTCDRCQFKGTNQPISGFVNTPSHIETETGSNRTKNC